MAAPVGKGFYIWKVSNCEKGDNEKIAYTARRAGLTHVLVKIANGIYDYNYDVAAKKDLVAPLAEDLLKYNIKTWGWHYVFGDLPQKEAKAAIRQIQKMPLEGYVIDAEAEYKGKYTACRIFMNELRSALPDFPMVLSSYRYPKYHNNLPWNDFLSKCEYNMPQVYWEQSHNPDEQLERCVNEFQTLVSPVRPIIPTGSAYGANAWRASPEDIQKFMHKAVSMGLSGVNFWSWDYCRKSLPALWDTIANFEWPGISNPSLDIVEKLVRAINSHDWNALASFYKTDAIHITSARTIQGQLKIKSWFEEIFTSTYKDSPFEVTKISGDAPTRHFSWKLTLPNRTTKVGSDTIGLSDGLIIYHYSSLDE